MAYPWRSSCSARCTCRRYAGPSGRFNPDHASRFPPHPVSPVLSLHIRVCRSLHHLISPARLSSSTRSACLRPFWVFAWAADCSRERFELPVSTPLPHHFIATPSPLRHHSITTPSPLHHHSITTPSGPDLTYSCVVFEIDFRRVAGKRRGRRGHWYSCHAVVQSSGSARGSHPNASFRFTTIVCYPAILRPWIHVLLE